MTAQSSLLSGKRFPQQSFGTAKRSAAGNEGGFKQSNINQSVTRVKSGNKRLPSIRRVLKHRSIARWQKTLPTGVLPITWKAGQARPKLQLEPDNLSLLDVNGEFAKRLFDIVFSLFVLVVFSPVYLLIGLIIALSSPGPIFYVQERVGKNFQRFNCIKFRTMVCNADAVLVEMMESCPHTREEFEGNFKLKHDPRITPIGRFLRITSLDEFPQFWNVLKGDMSVVGARPLVTEELPKYGCHIEEILTLKPGITGLWQVSGRNDIPYPRRVQIDLHYTRFRTFVLDLWIVFKTIGVVVILKNNGAY